MWYKILNGRNVLQRAWRRFSQRGTLLKKSKKWGNALSFIGFLVLIAWLAHPQNPGESPKQALSPKLYDQLQGKTDPLAQELHEMRADLNRFGNQHGDILVEIRGLKVHAEDMQREVNAERARVDSMDPSKAAERLKALEDFVSQQKKAAEEQAQLSAARWSNIMGWLRVVASLIGGLVANEARKLVAGWWKKRKSEKGVDSSAGGGA